MPATSDRNEPRFKFGDVAVALGLLSLEQVQAAAVLHAERQARGDKLSLGEYLIEAGLLTAEEVRLVLSEQGYEILVCSNAACALRFNIADYDPGKIYRCKQCNARLGFPGFFDRDMRVDITSGDSAADWKLPEELEGEARSGGEGSA